MIVALLACSEPVRLEGVGSTVEQAREAYAADATLREQRFRMALDPTWVPAPSSDSPGEMVDAGRALFGWRWTPAQGWGTAESSSLRRFQTPTGGPDALRCSACHRVGGPAGAGAGVDNAYLDGDGRSPGSALERNPPSLQGVGLLELLAQQITRDLQRGGASQGVTFEAQHLDADRVVRPFGWKGTESSLAAVIDRELSVHLGLQGSEVTGAQRSALTLYVATQPPPSRGMPEHTDLVLGVARGAQDFETLGCADCHTPHWTLETPVWGSVRLADGPVRLSIYSDLRRHDMGPALADARDSGSIGASVFQTPPLWGLASSAPYLHDGRAPTIEAAILAHGGEAQAARDAFDALGWEERAPLRLFLTSLRRPRRVTLAGWP